MVDMVGDDRARPRDFMAFSEERGGACGVLPTMTNDVTDILDDLDDLSSSEDEVSLGDVVKKVGQRGQGAFLAIPGLIGMTPVGGIPGVPTLFGVTVAIVALQMVAGRKGLWLPDMIERRSVGQDKLGNAVDKMRKPARWIDRHFGQRLQWATGRAATRVAALFALAFACLLPPLEVVPFAALIPFTAIALLGLSLTMRDGILMLISFAASAVAFWQVWLFLPFS